MHTRRVSACSAPLRRSERSAQSLHIGVEAEVEGREPQAVSCLSEALCLSRRGRASRRDVGRQGREAGGQVSRVSAVSR